MRHFLVRAALAVGWVAVAAGCASVRSPSGSTIDVTPRVAVISAFDAELDRLRAATVITATRVINGRTHYLGRLAGQDVVLLLSGYSMVNAAMTTQSLLDRFVVRRIVFSGIAGGVNPGLGVGDVTVPGQWGSYQEQVFARAAAGGWDNGGMAGEFASFGMMFPRASSVAASTGRPDSLERLFWFPVDSASLSIAQQVSQRVRLARCTQTNECLSREPRVVLGGRGVSGSTFVDNADYREWVWQTFHADALDMETAAVAQVAYQNRVPYIAFRSLSDLAGGGAGRNEVRIFGRLAADNSAALVLAFLKALPPQ